MGDCLFLPHRSTAQGDEVRVVDQSVADGVRHVGFSDGLVPSFRGKLSCDHSGGAVVTVLEDLQQVATFDVRHRCEQKIIEYQDCYFGKAREHLGIGSIGTCNRELLEQPWGSATSPPRSSWDRPFRGGRQTLPRVETPQDPLLAALPGVG